MIDSRQFIISKKPYNEKDFKNISLSNGYIFSYHKDLYYYHNSSKDVLLIGYASKIDSGIDTPESEIEELSKELVGEKLRDELLSREIFWCGRYVLIIDGRVYLDATGLLGIYYSEQGISSSCSLLSKITGDEIAMYKDDRATINWLPSPYIHCENIKKLLPSQSYDIESNELYSRPLLAALEKDYGSERELIDDFVKLFIRSLRNLKDKFPDHKIYIPLTGGHDSRTVMALAHKAGLEYTCFTLERDNMSEEDRSIPQKICDGEGIPYIFVRRNKESYSQNNKEQYEKHTCGMANDEDKNFYSYNQYQMMLNDTDKALFLRGHVWECVIEYYRKYVAENLPDELMYEHFGGYSSKLILRSLIYYKDWVENNKEPLMNKADRFLWEQRVGGWMSAIEQGFDLLDGVVSIHPVNSRFLLSMLLKFPREERIKKRHQEKIVEYCWDELTKYEYEQAVPYGFSVVHAGKLALKRLKSIGLMKTMIYYRAKLWSKMISVRENK